MDISELRIKLQEQGLTNEIMDSLPDINSYLSEICDIINDEPNNEDSMVLATSIMILMVYNGFDQEDSTRLMNELSFNSEEYRLEDGSVDVEWLLKKIKLGI